MNYLVILFKNKHRKKILNKFKSKSRAENYFEKLISEDVVFEKKIENGYSCSFDVAILEKNNSNSQSLYFVKDELGRQLKVETDDPDYKIIKISNYKIEEEIFDLNENKKIKTNNFIKKYLPKIGIKLISKLNNKIIVQNDDIISLFSLKSESDCERFLDVLNKIMFNKKRSDCIIVPDSSKQQKKYLYTLLENKGISKSKLYKKSTTFFKG